MSSPFVAYIVDFPTVLHNTSVWRYPSVLVFPISLPSLYIVASETGFPSVSVTYIFPSNPTTIWSAFTVSGAITSNFSCGVEKDFVYALSCSLLKVIKPFWAQYLNTEPFLRSLDILKLIVAIFCFPVWVDTPSFLLASIFMTLFIES